LLFSRLGLVLGKPILVLNQSQGPYRNPGRS
jgi:hypothetical protein